MEIKSISKDTDEMSITLNNADDFVILHINNALEVKIARSDMGYIIDTYKEIHASEEELDDYDFDADFIDTMTIWDMDLEGEENE